MKNNDGIFLSILRKGITLLRKILLGVGSSLRKSFLIQSFFALKKRQWVYMLLIFLGSFFATVSLIQLIQGFFGFFILNGVISLLFFCLTRYNVNLTNFIISSKYSILKKVSKWSNALKI
jgi:hypothetical protein|tara:strand:+ start:713 stop:1072 length:360 start_codon:yes stop_codon:yes gene_type:complete